MRVNIGCFTCGIDQYMLSKIAPKYRPAEQKNKSLPAALLSLLRKNRDKFSMRRPKTNNRNEWPETIWLTRKMLSWHSTGPESMPNRSVTVLDEWEPFTSGDRVDF